MMPVPTASGAVFARRRAACGRVWWIGVAVVAGLSIFAVAGFWGYRTQTSTWPTPAPATRVPAAGIALTAGGAAPASTETPQPASGYVAKSVAPRAEQRLSAAGSALQPEPLQWPLWEFLLRQPIAPRNPPLTPPAWRLIGASQSAGTWSIIVMRQGKTTPEYFKTGESLPGGYRIQSITEEDVTLVKGKLPVILSYIGSR